MLEPVRVIQFIILIITSQFITNALSTTVSAAEIEDKNLYQDCVACHENEYKHWQESDHAKSMALSSESTVVGNFDNKSVYHFYLVRNN